MKKRKLNKTKMPGIVVAVFVYFLLSCAFSIFVAVQTAMVGAEISRIETDQEVIAAQNNQLNETLLNSSSLSLIYEKADEMGFIEASKIIYSRKDIFTAKLP